MSYAQKHRVRLKLHQSNTSTGTDFSLQANTPTRVAASAHGDQMLEVGPQRSSSSLLRANVAHIQQSQAAGIDIAAWSGVASDEVTGERQPFQLLQHTPPRNEPPRLKASRKQFASPRASAAQSEANQSLPMSLPAAVNVDSLNEASTHSEGKDLRATDLRTGSQASATNAAAVGGASSHAHIDQHTEVPLAGKTLPSSFPTSHQLSPSQAPHEQLAESSACSSARASALQWPASETFAARLQSMMGTRQQIEALVQKQREDEEEMVHAIAALEQQQQSLSSQNSALAAGTTVGHQAYEQILIERDAAVAALREFKEKGNVIVHRLYDTVKLQQEQSLELVATVEALKRANKRLKEAVSSGNGGRASDNTSASAPGTVAELQQKVIAQRRVIDQMDQLMQNADRMLLAMRARVEAAERQVTSSIASSDRRQLPPLSKGGASGSARTTCAGDGTPAAAISAATVATPDAVAAIERLLKRYPVDQDVVTAAAQQQLLLERIFQLRQSLKQEEAQRLHLEEVYGATSEETARNVALLEERLQRAESPRGVPFNGANSASNASALRHELRMLLQEGEGNRASGAGTGKEGRKHILEDAYGQRSPTHSNASSQASSRSSTPSPTLFTAVSIGDMNTATAASDIIAKHREEKKVDSSASAAAAVPELAKPLPAASPQTDSSTSPRPQHKEEGKQPRAFLVQLQGSESDKGEGAAAAASVAKPLLCIPVPDASSLGNSLRRSFNSRSSSASRRLVDFRPAVTADATSRGLDSMSDAEGEEETVDANVEFDEVPESNGNSHRSGITGATPTATPITIQSASSPPHDTSISAKRSAKRQQRLYRLMEQLDSMEADVA
ncbi:hypothetical protein ABL78_4597 [Leptomonas seymouri]|uniref:Uncharacterized protein n=1 Tax=Leptomonas seymouri TaxID=5684 RepID=A0A0N1I4N2_LEPSE|nr:hypothetical protein ABL78_4597 [Leptomonas seymouri]|eukprot:KPI86331.1 hypothetical protein ABL78_4597 [Leptomonas seymouri]